MKVSNLDTFKNKKYLVFITSYCGMDYFLKWSKKLRDTSENIQLVLVDAGNQEIASIIDDIPIFQASKNIGCAGCWNLAAHLGFYYYNYDKIIIGQDDAIFSEEMLRHVWSETNDNILVGTYDRGFTYSLYGLTKKFFKDVGIFDENFIYGSYEDNDYIHRIKISNKDWKSLNYSANLNSNVATSKLTTTRIQKNKEYMIEKWGHFEGIYKHPFNNPNMKVDEFIIHQNLIEVHGNVDKFPSITEFEQFMTETTKEV